MRLLSTFSISGTLLWRLPALLLLALLGICGGTLRPAQAQVTLPDTPRLSEILPPAGERGATVEVTLTGERLAGATSLVCLYSPFPSLLTPAPRGLKAENVRSTNDGQVTARLTIPADTPPGLHQIRVVTASGVTNAGYFQVTQYAQSPEQEPNNSPSQAKPVSVPTVIAGVIGEPEDRDCFSFEVKSGETLILEVEGFKRYAPPQNQQMGITYLDSFLELHDASGHELAYSDDDTRLDAFLAYTFPAAGKYTVCLRDTLYRGRGDFHYRLSIGARPTITGVVPPGGQQGTRGVVTVYGYNLDEVGSIIAKRSINFETPGVQELRVTSAAGISNAVPLLADPLVEVPEVEPNDTIADGTPLVIPSTASGKFDTANDVDIFRFQAQGGQLLILDVSAARLGSPVDTALLLRNRGGEVIAQNDDNPAGSDSRLEVTIPATDEYALLIRNQLRSGSGPRLYYRIAIRTPQPTFGVTLQREGVNRQGGKEMTPVDFVPVPQGGSVEFEAVLDRREGQTGDVSVTLSTPQPLRPLKLEELTRTEIPGQPAVNGVKPTRITISPTTPAVKSGQNKVTLRLTAPPTVPPGTYLNLFLRFTGSAGSQTYSVAKPFWVTISPKQ